MLAILKRELKVYYTSLFAYTYYALFFLVTGIFFAVSCLDNHSTEFGYYVIGHVFYVVLAILPFCTMKLFAMERKHKTDQLLFTAPVSSFSVLFAKYVATVIYALLPLAVSTIYPIVISMKGTMSVRFVVGSYIGCVLSVIVLLSVGMFVSTLTTNVVLAVVISYAIYALTLLARIAESLVTSEKLRTFIHETSVYNIFNDMISGIVRSGDIVYLLVLSVLFFLLAWIILESRRQSTKKMIVYTTILVVLCAVISGVAMNDTRVYDFTPERLLTLSNQTIEVVSKVEEETDIYYIGEKSRANATYREFLNQYEELNDNVKVHYKNVSTDAKFQMQYMSDLYEISEASMLIVCGERYIYLDSSDYIDTTEISDYSSVSHLEMESQLTSAIYYVNAEEMSKLTVVSGHSEEALNSDFSNMLYLNGYEIENVDLSSEFKSLHSVFSSDCKAVIVNAPQSDYSETEIDELERYLKNGGNLFVILDPLNEDTTNLFAFLQEYGLDVQQGIVMERETGMYAENTAYYLIPKMLKTEYTEEIFEKNLHIYSMTSKGILPNGSGNGYTSTDVLMTSGKAFSKVDDFENVEDKGDNDIGGPFSVASCATSKEAGGIFLVTSNVLFNEQADAVSEGANRKFFLEVMKQLTDEESVIWIDGKVVGNQVALYPYETRTLVKIVTIIIVPISILLLGIIVIVMRNKNIMLRMMEKKDGKNEKWDDESNSES